jgi:hypothetical protein
VRFDNNLKLLESMGFRFRDTVNRRKNRLHLFKTSQGIPSLISRDGFSLYENMDPAELSTRWVAKIPASESPKHVLFYGAGLGYHILQFAQRYPDIPFSIYEPSSDALYYLLHTHDLTQWPLERLRLWTVEKHPVNGQDFVQEMLRKFGGGSIMLFDHPGYTAVFQQQVQVFHKTFAEALNHRVINRRANSNFQKQWTLNSMANLSAILSSPNLLLDNKASFAGKTVILIAAGPSLDDEIENLRIIKRQGTAFLLSVGSAIHTLIKHDVYPDAVCSYDPGHKNWATYKAIIEHRITTIPLIFGSSVDLNTVSRYPGPLYHVVTSQDTVSEYYCKPISGQALPVIQDAPSVAVVALQLLYHLRCKRIILVGQNFGFRDERYYATGTYYGTSIPKKHKDVSFHVEGVTGERVLTSPTYNSFRLEMEKYISYYRMNNVINATCGGARIQGTSYVPLDTIMQTHLTSRIIEPFGLKQNYTPYDHKYMDKQKRAMDSAYADLRTILLDLVEKLFDLEWFLKANQADELSNCLSDFDVAFKRLQNNSFFQVFLLPMLRVAYEDLFTNVDSIRFERDHQLKVNHMKQYFGNFVHECRIQLKSLSEPYESMNEQLQENILLGTREA